MQFYTCNALVYRACMHSYPIFLDLSNKHCLVVGAGVVGIRKIKGLLAAGATSLLILDMAKPCVELAEIINNSKVAFERRPFEPQDADNVFLAVAATSDPKVNKMVAKACQVRSVLCNIADRPELSSFIVPASIKRGDLTVTISTAGQSPALARHLRRKLESHFGNEYELMTTIMGRLRPLLLGLGLKTKDNTAVFRAIVESDLLDALASLDLDTAAASLRDTLPQDLHDKIGELLNAIA